MQLLPPAGLTPEQADALPVPEHCPPGLLAVLVAILREAAAEQAGAPLDAPATLRAAQPPTGEPETA